MNNYKHLTKDEKENARTLQEQGFSLIEIAFKLKRYPYELSCEFRRNGYKNGNFTANYEQKLSENRRCMSGKNLILKSEQFHRYIHEHHVWGWSAEQISERVKTENLSFPTSYATIYHAVDSDVMTKQTKKLMRFKWEYKKHKSTEKRGEIQATTSIHDRPASIETRLEVGHWESDTVIGMRK